MLRINGYIIIIALYYYSCSLFNSLLFYLIKYYVKHIIAVMRITYLAP